MTSPNEKELHEALDALGKVVVDVDELEMRVRSLEKDLREAAAPMAINVAAIRELARMAALLAEQADEDLARLRAVADRLDTEVAS